MSREKFFEEMKELLDEFGLWVEFGILPDTKFEDVVWDWRWEERYNEYLLLSE